MSAKLPVERAITDGYHFAFTRFLSILGTIWLPYLVFALIAIGLAWLMVPDLPRIFFTHDVDIADLMGLGRLAALIAILGFIVGAMVTVGLQRKALGRHPRPVFVFFSLGAAVWRMAAALFLATLVVFFIALLTAGVCTAIWFAARGLEGAMWLVRVLDVLAGAAFVIYIALRLLFFLPAVVVAEERIGIERAWVLGGHNFWRILIVAIAVIVPVAVAFHFLSWAIFGAFAPMPGMGVRMTMREIVHTVLLQFGPFVILFQLLERIVLLGVTNGAVASAYLSVAGRPELAVPAAPVPPGVAAA
ncbi:MAG TPA: hypothetical protein VIY09_00885 [Rhizomicrobium sp.]